MYGNQLEFKQENDNCLFYQKNEEYDEYNENILKCESQNYYYMDDLKKLHLEEHIRNNNSNFPKEQLEYYNKEDYEFRSLGNNHMQIKDTPKPLVFNKSQTGVKTNLKKKKKKMSFNNLNNYNRIGIKINNENNKKQEKKLPLKNVKSAHTLNTFNFTSCNKSVNGLFDPNLKKNELDLPKRSQIQRLERTEKIKNYDIKFGTKLKKLQMYNNYMDVLEDLEQINEDKKLNVKSYSKFNPPISKNLEKIKELEDKMPKPLNIPLDNLNFDFESHEQVIRSLEEQIQNERKMRTEVNMKYFQKMKELENLQNKTKTINSKLTPVNKKSKIIAKRFNAGNRKPRNRKKKLNHTNFKSEINKSMNLIDRNIIKESIKTRNKSVDIINEKMKELSPQIDKIIDKSFNNINKSILINNKTLMKNLYQNNKNNLHTKSLKINSYQNETPNKNVISPINNTQFLSENNIDSFNNLQNNLINNQSLNFNSLPNQIFNHNSNGNNQSNTNNMLFSYSQNNQIENKNQFMNPSMTNLEVIASLSKDVANYNKGLPQLIEKVESTIQKITKNDILNSDKIHPLIQMASKHTGQSVHLHIEEIVDSFIDDMLFDCVQVLQQIEDNQNKKQDFQNLKNYIKDYYQDFEIMKNLELDITKKLCSNAKYYPETQKQETNKKIKEFNHDHFKELNDFHNHNSNVETKNLIKIEKNYDKLITPDYQNPFNNNLESSLSINNEKKNSKTKMVTRYKTIISPALTKNLENYSQSYFEYMKTTGAFIVPNIFCFYEDLTKEIVNEALEEELDYCIKQLDSFVTDIYKEEVINYNK